MKYDLVQEYSTFHFCILLFLMGVSICSKMYMLAIRDYCLLVKFSIAIFKLSMLLHNYELY